jgi:hypothetical protein
MTEQCCGKLRTTAFCPDCGKQMKHESPLHELRKHCVDRRKILVTALKNNKINLTEELKKPNTLNRDDNVRYLERSVASDERAILKWDRWIDALDAILSPQEEKTNA